MLSQLFAGKFDAQGGSIPVHAVKAIVIDFSVKNTVFSLRQSENRPLIAPIDLFFDEGLLFFG